MPAGAPFVVDLVSSELEGSFHFLVGHPPIAAEFVEIVAAVLQENANRLWLVFADQRWIIVAAAQADVSADGAKDPRKGVRPFPGCRESADSTARGTANRAVVSRFGELDWSAIRSLFGFDIGQQFFQKKTHVVIAQAVVFIAAVETIERLLMRCL